MLGAETFEMPSSAEGHHHHGAAASTKKPRVRGLNAVRQAAASQLRRIADVAAKSLSQCVAYRTMVQPQTLLTLRAARDHKKIAQGRTILRGHTAPMTVPKLARHAAALRLLRRPAVNCLREKCKAASKSVTFQSA